MPTQTKQSHKNIDFEPPFYDKLGNEVLCFTTALMSDTVEDHPARVRPILFEVTNPPPSPVFYTGNRVELLKPLPSN